MSDTIVVLSATNRPESVTRLMGYHLSKQLAHHDANVRFFSLEDLPKGALEGSMYREPDHKFRQIEKEFVQEPQRYLFVIPEYNGSFPGALKSFIDACDVSAFAGKKAALVGLASGKSGNLRGLDHFTAILQHLKVHVLHRKVRIPDIGNNLKNNGEPQNKELQKRIEVQLKELVTF